MKKFIYTILLLGTIFPFQKKLCAQALKSPASESGSSNYTFYNIEFADHNTGFIVGMDWNEKHSIILGTADTGYTWKAVPHPTIYNGDDSFIFDVSFSDPMNGWATGSKGWVLHTVDGGKNWMKKSISTSGPIGSVFCLDTGNVWIGRNDSQGVFMYRTTDGFESWELYYPGIKTWLWDLYFTNADTGIAALGWCNGCVGIQNPDRGGFILRTTNGGVDWTVQKHDTTIYSYFRIYFLNDTTGYVAGSDGSLLRTDDGGLSWSELTSGTDLDIWGVYFANADTGIITIGDLNTWTGKIYRTTDGGAKWTQPDISYTNHNPIFALAHSEECTLVAPQDGCNILKSTDCGATWGPGTFIPPSHDASLSDLQVDGVTVDEFASDKFDYDIELQQGTTSTNVTATTTHSGATIAGDGAIDVSSGTGTASIVVTAEDGTTKNTYTINFTVTGIGENAMHILKIYPNPVSSLLNIETVKTDRYSIELSGLTGQTLFREIFTGHSYRIDLSSFPEGIYFITIWSGDFVRTKKIIKL